MSDEKMLRFESALEKILQKSKASQAEEAVLSLSLTALQAAIDNSSAENALKLFEECADIYSSIEEPDTWMGNRLGQLGSRLQVLLKGSGKTATESPIEPADLLEQ